jgi:hypothetical protein
MVGKLDLLQDFPWKPGSQEPELDRIVGNEICIKVVFDRNEQMLFFEQ